MVVCDLSGREQQLKQPSTALSLPAGKHPAPRHKDTWRRESGTVSCVYSSVCETAKNS